MRYPLHVTVLLNDGPWLITWREFIRLGALELYTLRRYALNTDTFNEIRLTADEIDANALPALRMAA